MQELIKELKPNSILSERERELKPNENTQKHKRESQFLTPFEA